MIDQEKETDALYQDIMDKKTEVREPVYEQEAQSRNTNDIGYSYIEIDLTRQRMVLYQNGSPIVDTGFAASSSTPTGVYRLGDKQEAASVDFWMPFTDKLGIYGDSGLVITGTDVSDETWGFWRFWKLRGECGFWLLRQLDEYRRLYSAAGRAGADNLSECRFWIAGSYILIPRGKRSESM